MRGLFLWVRRYHPHRRGLTRFALSLSNWLRQLSNPGRGFSSPRRRATCEKKARIFMRALLQIWR
ncbi:hypothetical protein D8768_16265 [Enterobacter hormaechei]|nr:hypothetical protein D8768_16265 [Enterobacter hormaechei]